MRALPRGGLPPRRPAGTVHVTSPAESDDESDAIAGPGAARAGEPGGSARRERWGRRRGGGRAADQVRGGAAETETPAFAARTRSRRACASRWRSPRESNPSRRCTRRNCRHQLTMAQMASHAGSRGFPRGAFVHALRVKTDAAAANGNALLQAQLVAAMQNPAAVGAVPAVADGADDGDGRVGGARGAPAMPASAKRPIRSLRDGDDAGVVRRVRGHRSSRGGAGDGHPHARGWDFDGVVRDSDERREQKADDGDFLIMYTPRRFLASEAPGNTLGGG